MKRTWMLVLAALTCVAAWWLYQGGVLQPEAVLVAVRAEPVWGVLIFMISCVLMTVLLLPVSLMFNLAAGMIWGAWWGGVLTTTSLTLSAILAFMMARYAGQHLVVSVFERRNWSWMLDALRTHGWSVIFLSRINPVVPFGPANYLFGLTTVPLSRYITATLAGNFLPALFYAAVGASAGTLVLSGDIKRAIVQGGVALLLLSALYIVKVVLRRSNAL